jgi:microcystin-dependent protein
MSENYVGEIRMFAGNFAPSGWALCQGQLLPISENDVLFTLIGTTYGGDGESTFALPNLAGRVAVHQGTGGSGTTYQIGQAGGVESVTLNTNQIPVHTHPELATEAAADQLGALNNMPAEAVKRFYGTPGAPVAMNATNVLPVGGSQPHDNMQPYLVLNFIISLFGVFPNQT